MLDIPPILESSLLLINKPSFIFQIESVHQKRIREREFCDMLLETSLEWVTSPLINSWIKMSSMKIKVIHRVALFPTLSCSQGNQERLLKWVTKIKIHCVSLTFFFFFLFDIHGNLALMGNRVYLTRKRHCYHWWYKSCPPVPGMPKSLLCNT